MRVQDIKIGEYYRLAHSKVREFGSDYYGWVKVLEVYKANTWNNPHPEKKSCVKCEHTVTKDSTCGFIRYFRPSELVKET